MVGTRTLRSLAQFLELQKGELITLLLEMHGLLSGEVSDAVLHRTGLISPLVKSLDAGGESEISVGDRDVVGDRNVVSQVAINR